MKKIFKYIINIAGIEGEKDIALNNPLVIAKGPEKQPLILATRMRSERQDYNRNKGEFLIPNVLILAKSREWKT